MTRIVADAAWTGGRLLAGVALEVQDGVIRSVSSVPSPGRDLVLMPAFANAHVHLELSSLRGEDLDGSSFAGWVESLVTRRRQWQDADFEKSIAEGVHQLLASGTVAVGDIDSSGYSLPLLRETPLEGVVYHEVLEHSDEQRWELLRRRCQGSGEGSAGGMRGGVSPHAPFSTGPRTYRRCLELAATGIPLASHLAETEEELDLLRDRSGPLGELFERWAVSVPDWSDSPGAVDLLAAETRAEGALLLVHCNYLDENEKSRVAASGHPLVYCPRSHAYFGHPAPHPATELARRGARVALGTDSRASNSGLDLWGEMATWRRRDSSVSPRQILDSATREGRSALELAAADLAPGQPATFQVVRPRERGRVLDHWLESLVDEGWETWATVIRGEVVAGDPGVFHRA